MVSDFKNAFPGIFNFTVGILVVLHSHQRIFKSVFISKYLVNGVTHAWGISQISSDRNTTSIIVYKLFCDSYGDETPTNIIKVLLGCPVFEYEETGKKEQKMSWKWFPVRLQAIRTY